MKIAEIVSIPVGNVELTGQLVVPTNCKAIVVFAHGSGSSRFSPRNQYVADVLQSASIGTLLLDLLTPEESEDRSKVFDIEFLTRRLESAINFVKADLRTAEFPVGLFGASTGAAAALTAAVNNDVFAVVSRGGRPDLVERKLESVSAPTLLIVGGDDFEVLDLNRAAAKRLRCRHEIAVIPGASHLFSEAGALVAVAERARDWLLENLEKRK